LDSSTARFAKPALLCCAVVPSSHFTCSRWRALLAPHHVSATIATPPLSVVAPIMPSAAVCGSTTNAWRTPGIVLI
jgi:hypothetical protein